MKEWELGLGLADAEGLTGQWEEGGFPGTTQMKAQKQKQQVSTTAGETE